MSGRHLYFSLAALLVGLIISLFCGEIIFRLAGRKPLTAYSGEGVSTHSPDDELGWINTPGEFRLPGYDQKGRKRVIQLTILPDSSRATSPDKSGFRISNSFSGNRADSSEQPVVGDTTGEDGDGPTTATDGGNHGDVAGPDNNILLLVGGSFTQGWAVSDDETYAWKLQALRPDLDVHNFGTGAYGTFQSLLMLERLFRNGIRPRFVVYGFYDDHEFRNVASAAWLKHLARYSKRGHVAVPYCSIGLDGSLVRHPPLSYSHWPLRESSAVISACEDLVFSLRAKQRTRNKRRITRLLLKTMRELCRSVGARFYVALLWLEPEALKDYREFFANEHFSLIDCLVPIRPELLVPVDGHPNPALHTKWARIIAASIAPVSP